MPMYTLTKARKVGDSMVLTIPKSVVDRFLIKPGAPIHVIETELGILITPEDPTVNSAVAAYKAVAEQFRRAMRVFAMEPRVKWERIADKLDEAVLERRIADRERKKPFMP